MLLHKFESFDCAPMPTLTPALPPGNEWKWFNLLFLFQNEIKKSHWNSLAICWCDLWFFPVISLAPFRFAAIVFVLVIFQHLPAVLVSFVEPFCISFAQNSVNSNPSLAILSNKIIIVCCTLKWFTSRIVWFVIYFDRTWCFQFEAIKNKLNWHIQKPNNAALA